MSDETRREPGAKTPPAGTRREHLPGATRRETGTPEAETIREGAAGWRLPRIIANRFVLEREFDARGNEADAFLVRDDRGLIFAKVYRKGIEPNSKVLENLNAAAPEHVIKLLEAGYSEEDRCFYELLEFAELGTLGDLVLAEGPKLKPALVRTVLQELNDAMQHVHGLDIEHRDLKPENILVRSREPLDLVLTDFGIASAMEATHRFTSKHRTVRYSPPEAISGAVHRTRWDYWSLGIILVELLTGKSPFGDASEQVVNLRLISNPTDELVEGVKDPAWRKLCRGLLRRDTTKRWDGASVRKWLANPDDTSLIVADESGGATSDQTPPFHFRGKPYRSAPALGEAFANDWAGALETWKTKQSTLVTWLRDDVGATVLADQLKKLDQATDANTSENALMFAVIQALVPAATPSFLGRPVTAAAIGGVAEAAMNGDPEATAWLLDLHRDNILMAITRAPSAERALSAVRDAWNEAIPAYQQRAARMRTESGDAAQAPAISGAFMAQLLAAATPNCKALNLLRVRADEAATEAARKRLWFNALGEPKQADAVSALLIVLMAPAAEAEVNAGRQQRQTRNDELWGYMGAGIGVALAVGTMWWMAVAGYCSSPHPMCQAFGWPMRTFGVADAVFVGAATVAALAVLMAVNTKTTGRG